MTHILKQTENLILCSSNRMNPKRPTTKYIMKMAKIEDIERILKAVREKRVNFNGGHIRLSADFPIETLQARRKL